MNQDTCPIADLHRDMQQRATEQQERIFHALLADTIADGATVLRRDPDGSSFRTGFIHLGYVLDRKRSVPTFKELLWYELVTEYIESAARERIVATSKVDVERTESP